MILPDLGTDIVFQALSAAFPMFEGCADFRFEVRPRASLYVRRAERQRGEDVARINRVYIRNFPNLPVLRSYIVNHGIQMDHTERDYVIRPEHIDDVIAIVGGARVDT